MTIAVLDKHDHISYQNLNRLYWGEYAYRAHIEVPEKDQKRCRDANALRRARDRILDTVAHDSDLTFRSSAVGYSFFFKDGDEAARFIDTNADQIKTVTRPTSPDELVALEDPRVCLRNTLWFGRYGFVVKLLAPSWKESDSTIEDVDAFVTNHFGTDSDRARYMRIAANSRRLYLRDESDVILLKLALDDDKIGKIEIANLRAA